MTFVCEIMRSGLIRIYSFLTTETRGHTIPQGCVVITAEEFRQNKLDVERRIARAAERAGRKTDEVRVMAVTKTLPEGVVRLAQENGVGIFGENRVQEATEKYTALRDSVELHLIGHLQRNKAKAAARLFSWVDSIDKWETAVELDKRAGQEERRIAILVEVNTSGEDSKFGVRTEAELWDLVPRLRTLDRLVLRGLMTVGPLTGDRDRVRRAFRDLSVMYQKLKGELPSLDILSMGMSGDFEIAVEEGSNLVRIGTALLGPRK